MPDDASLLDGEIAVENPLLETFNRLADQIKPECPEYAANLKLLTQSAEFNSLNPDGLNAIITLTKHAKENGRLIEANKEIFEPIIPDKAMKEHFGDLHVDMYMPHARKIAQDIMDGNVYALQLISGMYGGKSTLAHLITEKLKQNGYFTETIMLASLKDPKLDVRALKDDNTKHLELEYRRHKQVDAKKVSDEWYKTDEELEEGEVNKKIWEVVVDQILSHPNPKKVVHFDEYSFDADLSQKIVNRLLENGVVVLLAGLNTDILVRDLPGFTQTDTLINNLVPGKVAHFECKSFIAENCTESEFADGDLTRRFIRLANGLRVIDLGFAEMFIPKQIGELVGVEYLPANILNHPQTQLYEIDSDSANRIKNPSVESLAFQNAITKDLHARAEAETKRLEKERKMLIEVTLEQ